MITEDKIYSTDDNHHATFSTIEAMEECLKSMREISKVPPTYLNRISKKESVLNIY